MDPNEMVRVFTTYDLSEAEVVRIALLDEGIKCHLDNMHQGGLSHVLAINVLVRSEDVAHAREIIGEYQKKLGEAREEEEDEDVEEAEGTSET